MFCLYTTAWDGMMLMTSRRWCKRPAWEIGKCSLRQEEQSSYSLTQLLTAATLALNGNGGDNIDDSDDYLQALVV